MDHLALFSRKCKTCKHLDPEEEVAYDKCHFDKGNTECPAKEIQFAVVGQAKRLGKEVKNARSQGNFAREVEILNMVSNKTEAFQQKFREWASQ